MHAKVPWLPGAVPPGAQTDRCPHCGHVTLIPWTLRRDPVSKRVMRTWVCATCQQMEERPEPE